MKPTKTPYYSYRAGNLPKGCQQCVKGEKTVLFITGLCGAGCYYCPISDKKYGKDVILANEWPIGPNIKDLFEEIKLCSSKGVGITGGDPLVCLSRTVDWIKKLKKRFGKRFHIHLYTPLTLVTPDSLKKLHAAGLDEIRFHPKLEKPDEWSMMEHATSFNWDVGIEIPVIPGMKKHIISLIDYAKDINIKFMNLNELEIADNSISKLLELGHKPKDSLSYGVLNSEKLGKDMVRYCAKVGLRAHYCSATLKDRVQMAKRIKKRAKNAKKPYDHVDKEGLLVRGAIYPKHLQPGIGYPENTQTLSDISRKKIIARLMSVMKDMKQNHKIPSKYMELDKRRFRILTTVGAVQGLPKNLYTSYCIVKEYPTYDNFQVEVHYV
ncbi:MAG: hypothetical protein KKG59_03970 [Nanoarchaeota archaeon]|nr:hypothetical protein [Nanoarchaeota archaeon]